VTYVYETSEELEHVFSGERAGYVYSRFANPTVRALEQAVAGLEGTDAAVACSTGMAALHVSLLASGIGPGSSVLAANDLYGGTQALLNEVFRGMGVLVHRVDVSDPDAVATALEDSQSGVLLVETISNPLLRVADIAALADLAHARGSQLVVDNTFATPCLLRPGELGADYVVHSGTKYLGGHGDVMAGLVAGTEEACRTARELLKLVGCVLGPNEAWLLLRGLKTLVLRVREQCRNAFIVARFLASHLRVSRVSYPGLPTHPSYILGRSLFPTGLYGGVLSFEIKDAKQIDVFRFMDALRLVVPATSLGDVTSMVLYPAQSSHRALSEAERHAIGVADNLVRLSVGIEDPADIVADLDRALALSATR
jgi:cystathionine gamma-synthase/methionine-gamma-lyase